MKTNINKREIKLIAVTLVAGLFLGWVFFHSSGESSTENNHEGHTHAEKTVYTCSMHPQVRQNKPGLCPICAMELVPLSSMQSGDTENVDPNEIQLSESALALASVQTTVVKRGVPEKSLHLLGKVKADERNISELTARFGGRIEKLYINYTGQHVSKGQKLGEVYSPELITAQKELLEAIKYKETNPSFYRAARTKLKLWDLTENQIDAIEQQGEPRTYFDIQSPINGTVTKRHVAIGDYIKEGSPLFEVIDLSRVWVMFDAYESDLPWVKLNDKINFTIQSLPGKTFSGKVTYIDPFIDAKTRVAQIRIELKNSDMDLKPEMFANGILISEIKENPDELLIPKSSILWTGKRAVVYVKVPERETASFIYREVVLGPEAGNFYVVKEGLKEGETIAINGVFKIDAAAQLAGKASMMNPDGGKISTGHNHGSMSSEHKEHSMGDVNLEHANFKVSGNCEMCKKTIEKAVKSLEGVNVATWNVESKNMHVSFNKEKVSLSDIHKAIATSGYDTEDETASKAAYNKLPPCCQYTRASSSAKEANVEHVKFKVSGNCSMCKKRIEKSVNAIDGVNSADWDVDTKMIDVSFNNDKTSLDNIHNAIAHAGHDTEKKSAGQADYDSLPPCCQYSREGNESDTRHDVHKH